MLPQKTVLPSPYNMQRCFVLSLKFHASNNEDCPVVGTLPFLEEQSLQNIVVVQWEESKFGFKKKSPPAIQCCFPPKNSTKCILRLGGEVQCEQMIVANEYVWFSEEMHTYQILIASLLKAENNSIAHWKWNCWSSVMLAEPCYLYAVMMDLFFLDASKDSAQCQLSFHDQCCTQASVDTRFKCLAIENHASIANERHFHSILLALKHRAVFNWQKCQACKKRRLTSHRDKQRERETDPQSSPHQTTTFSTFIF